MFLHENMRIKSKYLRNRHARNKAWKRIVKFEGGLYSYKCYFPWWFHGFRYETPEQSIKDREEYFQTWWLRSLLGGNKKGHHNAPKWYRQEIERPERRAVKAVLDKMLKDVENVDDYDIPTFKHDANWDWF